RRNDLAAGALLTVLLIKPTYVAPFLVLLLVQRRFRAIVGFAGRAAVLAIGPLVVFGPAIVGRYASALHLASEFKMIGYDSTANQAVFGWLQMLGAPRTSVLIEAAIMG